LIDIYFNVNNIINIYYDILVENSITVLYLKNVR